MVTAKEAEAVEMVVEERGPSVETETTRVVEGAAGSESE